MPVYKPAFITKALMLPLFLIIFSGCSGLTTIPLSLNQARDYAFGREQTYAATVPQILVVAVLRFSQMGLRVERIENFQHYGFILAKAPKGSCRFELTPVTASLTKATVKFTKDTFIRERTVEKHIFRSIDQDLQNPAPMPLKDAVQGMYQAYAKKDKTAGVVAYFKPDLSIEILGRDEHWLTVKLSRNAKAYVPAKDFL